MPSPIMERVKAHKDALGRNLIEVPEWGDEDGTPLKIYSQPIVMYEMRKWYKGINADDISVLGELIIAKAENVDGDRMFTLEDKQALLRTAEFSVLSRIAGQMMETLDPDDLEKN